MPERDVHSIQVGDRVRRELGDIDSLAASICDIGLLHPIIITSEGKLLAGLRRLEAARRLGWATIRVRVVEDASCV
jgi:ParB family transcriptional regulator, chromosome partitioning protein